MVLIRRTSGLPRLLSRAIFVLCTFSAIFYLTTMGSLIQVVTFPSQEEVAVCALPDEEPTSSSTVQDIPRHFHQLWKSREIPEKWQKRHNHCRELNPDYQFTLWSDDDIEEFIAKKYPWFLFTYQNYPYQISRPDAARYFILHHYGGVYLDLDMECKVPFKNLI